MAEKSGTYIFDDADLFAAGSPLEEMRTQRMREIVAKLAEGIPVTITCGSHKLMTYFPDGSVENHQDGIGRVVWMKL